MKILMLADVFYPDIVGGSGRVAYNLSYELSKMGHIVYVLTRNPNAQLKPFQKISNGFFVSRFSIPTHKSIRLFLSEIRNGYLSSKRLERQIDFDIICVHQCMAAIGPSFIRKLRKNPIVYFYYSPWHLEYLTRKKNKTHKNVINDKLIACMMKFIEHRFLSKSSKIVVLSKYSFNQVTDLHNITKNNISIIPGGVNLNSFNLATEKKDALKSKHGIPETKIIFLTIRNLVPRMGIEKLIECFHRSQILKKKSILLIGGSGFLENYLTGLVDSYRLEKHVRILGHVLDEILPELYQTADFFLLPTSILEGFGLVILESMACGTPVIGTPVGAIPGILDQFNSRLIFEGSSWKDIKNKLERIVERPDSYYFDPKKCRKFVEDNYSWRKMALGFEKICLNLK